MTAAPDHLRGAGPWLFVRDIASPRVDPGDLHHLVRVLRVTDGDPVTVSDGDGRWRQGRFRSPDLVEATGPVVTDPPVVPPLTVRFAPVSGERNDWCVQKLTEAGVDALGALWCGRSVVRWDGRRWERVAARWARIARAAAAQSRRSRLPAILEPVDVGVVPPDGVVLADPAGDAPVFAPLLLVGPEGGWTEAERERFPRRCRLGSTVLRTETAAVAGAVVLGALRAGLVRPARSSGRAGRGAHAL